MRSQNDYVLKFLAKSFVTDAQSLEICDALTRAIADLYQSLDDKLENYEQNYLDPQTASIEWLDAIAHWNAWGDYWDNSWEENTKRKLLTNSEFIWRNRGNRQCIEFLFKCFELDAQMRSASGFKLNSTAFPGQIGTDPFSYEIAVSPSYGTTSKEYVLIQRLLELFLPCWLLLTIVYNG